MSEPNQSKDLIAFSFGEPEAIEPNRWLTDYAELFYDHYADYWSTPISRQGLAQIANTNAHHGALIYARRNMVAGRFKGGAGLKRRQMQAFVHDLIQFGDAAFLKIRNGLGRVVRLHPLPSMYLRRHQSGDFRLLRANNEQLHYRQDDVIYLSQYDPRQQIYGLPDYLGGIQSALLNRDATLFRRRYYQNGAHMGFIFYATDPNLSETQEEDLKAKIQSSKGVGNFRSLFINIPNGNPDGVKLIPVGDIATKDDFDRIKNISAQDVLTAHRFPPGQAGIIPSNAAGLGDPEKTDIVYTRNEVLPLCELIADEVNSDPDIPARLALEFVLE
ncbi:phage portal protein [Oceanimonas sp. AH20CE76]|uniref:phage portal protein n=1 Tax=Oceanimonas sp. AH20CE76 TaxID=2977120 RepID=UPI0031FEAD8C